MREGGRVFFFFPNHGHNGLGPTPSGLASKEQSAAQAWVEMYEMFKSHFRSWRWGRNIIFTPSD